MKEKRLITGPLHVCICFTSPGRGKNKKHWLEVRKIKLFFVIILAGIKLHTIFYLCLYKPFRQTL